MKTKKLEKRVQFIFKKITIVNLSQHQMKGINGGLGNGESIDDATSPSTIPGCDKTMAKTVISQ